MENDILDYEKVANHSSYWKNIKKWFHKNSSLYAFVGEKIHQSELIENMLSGMKFSILFSIFHFLLRFY